MEQKQHKKQEKENTLTPDLTSSFPSSSRITGRTPKKGNVADPGLVGVQPGNGVITWPPVSV